MLFAPLILDDPRKFLEEGVRIPKTNLNIAAWFFFDYINTTVMQSLNDLFHHLAKTACMGYIIEDTTINMGLIIVQEKTYAGHVKIELSFLSHIYHSVVQTCSRT